jgi:hypothetical protein
MRKTLTYSSFVVASLALIVVFVTATTYTQLGVAVLLYPLLVYFAYELFIRRNWKAPAITVQPQVKLAKKVGVETAKLQRKSVGIVDVDKREFLKMIGVAGISFFLFSIFTRRSESLFFGKAAGPGISALEDSAGNKIDPAERQPTDGYRISEIDDNELTFYGFINKNGGWFIMKEDPNAGSFRYIKGESDFPGNWTNRESLKYDYFHNIF